MAIFLGLTVTLAAAVVLYVVSVVRIFASPSGSARREEGALHPALGLIPVLTPVVAWRAGARALAVALAVSAALYVVLQLWAHAR